MWVAMLIVALASGDVNTFVAPEPMASEKECNELQSKVREAVNADKTVKAYVLKCVEIKADEVKANGRDA